MCQIGYCFSWEKTYVPYEQDKKITLFFKQKWEEKKQGMKA